MKTRSLWGLNLLLTVFITAFLASSIVKYLEHQPNWFLLTTAGLFSIVIFYKPKLVALILVTLSALFIAAETVFNVSPPFIYSFTENIHREIYEWSDIYHFPGPLITLVLSLLFVCGLVCLQLYLLYQDKKNFFIIPLGLIIYLCLWSQHYIMAERDLVIFLAAAFPALGLSFLQSYSTAPKFTYYVSILSLGILSSLIVSFIPETAFINIENLHEIAYKITMPFKQLQQWGEREIPLFQGRSVVEWGQTGYNPGGELGGPIVESHLPVMELKIIEGSLPSTLYLRGHASDYYTGKAWKNEFSEEAESLASSFKHVEIYDEVLKVNISYLQPHNHLFGFFPTNSIQIQDVEADHTGLLRFDSFGNISTGVDDFKGKYHLSGNIITEINLDNKEAKDELKIEKNLLHPFLQLPEDFPPRLSELSDNITSDANTELQKVQRVEEFLNQFPYNTMSSRAPTGQDFVDYFVFELQEGYCAYFASAMAVILRAQEIPTRYVEGYRVPSAEVMHRETEDEDEVSNYQEKTHKIQVQQNHAHAWVEVFLQGYGWVSFDPTPAYDISTTMNDPEIESEQEIEHPGEENESQIDDHEEDKEKNGAALNGKGTPPHDSHRVNWIFILTAIFLAGASIKIYLNYCHVKYPADLYTKIIRLKSVFHAPPAYSDTPDQILEQLKHELPALASKFEKLKHYYHLSCYSSQGEEIVLHHKELNTLAIKTARLYLKKLGAFKFARGMLALSLNNLRSLITLSSTFHSRF